MIPSRRRRRQRGIALLLVLWVFMILGVLALDFARYMRDDAMAAINLADETRGYYVALAGMNRALYDVERKHEQDGGAAAGTAARTPTPDTLDTDELDDDLLVPADGEWHEGDFAGGKWSVRMIDEGGRIAINRVQADVLTRVVTNLAQAHIAASGRLDTGFDRRSAGAVDTVVDSLLDWRDRDSLTRMHGAENDYYMKRRVPYHAKNAFFDSAEEMLLVRGVTPELFYGSDGIPGLRDVFTVYGVAGPAKVNVGTATPAVLQALLGIEPAAVEDLVAQRAAGTPIIDQVKAQLITAGQPILAEMIVDDQAPHIVRIAARADMAAERNRSRVEAVAEIGGEAGEGTRILRWLDRAPWEGAPPGAPSAGGPEDS
jgi:general secretion pathway protein K